MKNASHRTVDMNRPATAGANHDSAHTLPQSDEGKTLARKSQKQLTYRRTSTVVEYSIREVTNPSSSPRLGVNKHPTLISPG
ncbi:hypothetical protein SK128_024048 [Halocaridina rubra]|uniref:Uncharacterized protein n=1 Tax=Halocaridina rubra TaxID=373956 RepID=A0AAN9A3X2_HALRR